MNQKIKKILKLTAAVVIIIIGLLGLALPILPGWALLFAGISLIDHPHAKNTTEWIKKKFGLLKTKLSRKK